jgi:hypothetical protein
MLRFFDVMISLYFFKGSGRISASELLEPEDIRLIDKISPNPIRELERLILI